MITLYTYLYIVPTHTHVYVSTAYHEWKKLTDYDKYTKSAFCVSIQEAISEMS